MDRITYYQVRLTQKSPLRISAGLGEQTDSDVIRDRRGLPFIPGSSLAGLLREEFDSLTADRLFGYIRKNGETQESRLLVSDAVLPNDTKVRISRRDGVGLNERKTAIRGAKYDFEVVESDTPYVAVLELRDPDYTHELEAVLDRWIALGVSVGARTTRGYGSMDVGIRKRAFSIPGELDAWLDFDPFVEGAFQNCQDRSASDAKADGMLILRAALTMDGSYSVRMNTSALAQAGDRVVPDTVPMENRLGDPVVPGTSWAGAFRHHMRALAQDCGLGEQAMNEIDALFGVGGGKEKSRSAIRFSETDVKDSKRMTVTRTAIERYTAAPRNRALFTSQVAVGGGGELVITLPANTSDLLKGLLGVTLCDMNFGLLGFGGENGIGRGSAIITELTVNGIERTDELRAGDVTGLWKEETVC